MGDKTLDQVPKPTPPDSPRFADFYRAQYPGVVRLAHALTGSPETAEDVVQDAFSRLLGRIDELESPGGYLRTTVVNLCRDRQRRLRRDRRSGSLSRVPVPLSLGASEMIDVLLALPYRQRAVLVLRYWGDFSESDIAEALGCRPGTVKTLASRALARLKKEIDP